MYRVKRTILTVLLAIFELCAAILSLAMAGEIFAQAKMT